ncbi:hypothetical protein K457DRAFT_135394 [Linnemannia elongata AG-77]|uniref:Uncharacterized protein n=1 Tax=Linnemannia elongata AG-77 TaxID=1314771 RepID=A0A197K4T1_9FUNG|nr:hypothetical protein K457DRAFT_135394 [Linnemannia elongata AG-77]
MHDKRIIVLVSLALLVSSALADMLPREKWVRWGIDDCNGDPECWKELLTTGDEEMELHFCEDQNRPEPIFFKDGPWWDDICEIIPDPPHDAEFICGYT